MYYLSHSNRLLVNITGVIKNVIYENHEIDLLCKKCMISIYNNKITHS